MIMIVLSRLLSGGFLLWLLVAHAFAGSCVVGFDVGSSGIRAGKDSGQVLLRTDVDYLALLADPYSFHVATAPTVKAINDLMLRAGDDFNGCSRVAGGFSAWRMAASKDKELLAEVIRDIYTQTGVPLLVIPQDREAVFGYVGARYLLGDQLLTSHILDLGGGSLQVVSAKESFGLPLGQKTWHETLCVKLRGKAQCDLQPMSEGEIEEVRDFAFLQFRGGQGKLSEPIELTAVSRPVTKTLAPIVLGLTGIPGEKRFSLNALTASIDLLAKQTSAGLVSTLVVAGVSSRYVQFVLTDMLLVEGLLKSTGAAGLRFAEIELTNVPGLIADSQVNDWMGHFDCYLERFKKQGEDAFHTDVSTCRQ